MSCILNPSMAANSLSRDIFRSFPYCPAPMRPATTDQSITRMMATALGPCPHRLRRPVDNGDLALTFRRFLHHGHGSHLDKAAAPAAHLPGADRRPGLAERGEPGNRDQPPPATSYGSPRTISLENAHRCRPLYHLSLRHLHRPATANAAVHPSHACPV